MGFLTRYDGELREPLLWRQGSQGFIKLLEENTGINLGFSNTHTYSHRILTLLEDNKNPLVILTTSKEGNWITEGSKEGELLSKVYSFLPFEWSRICL